MKQMFKTAGLAGSLALVSGSALAQVSALDPAAAVTYLETNAGGAMIAIGAVILTLAGLGVAIKWAKATFFG